MNILNLWKHVAIFWTVVILSDSSFVAERQLPLSNEKNSTDTITLTPSNGIKVVANSTAGEDMSLNVTTTALPKRNLTLITTISKTVINATTPEPERIQTTGAGTVTAVVTETATATYEEAITKHRVATTLQPSLNQSAQTTQPSTSYSSSSGNKIEPSASTTTVNDTIVTNAQDSDSSMTEVHSLSPAILAVIAVVSTIVFFVIIYAIFKLVQSFTAVGFRRLHEMPMDDFDDYSGVYVEHTVPIRT